MVARISPKEEGPGQGMEGMLNHNQSRVPFVVLFFIFFLVTAFFSLSLVPDEVT